MKNILTKMCLALLVFTISACKSLQTNVNIHEAKLPNTFNEESGQQSIASINWKNYFADSALVNLIDTAILRNMDLQMALQRVEISKASARFSKTEMLPKIGLNTNGGVRRYGLYTMDGAGNISTYITPNQIVPLNLPDYYLGLQSTWEIDVWGKLKNQKRAAISNYLASIEGVNFVQSNLIAEIANEYYELLALDNSLDITNTTILNQQEALDVIVFQKEAGRVNELAVQQFNAQLLGTKALQKELTQQIMSSENKINFLLGRYPQAVVRKKERLFMELPNQIATGVPSQLLANRPDVKQAELQVKAEKFSLKAAKAAFYPNVNITSGVGFQAFKPEFLFLTPTSIAYTAIANLTAPLINRNAIKANFNTIKSQQVSALYMYQKTILNGYIEVANELNNIKLLSEISELKKQQSEVLSNSIETSQELYKSAKASYLELLLAQQNALQARLELVDATKRKRIATVNIYKALGGGWK